MQSRTQPRYSWLSVLFLMLILVPYRAQAQPEVPNLVSCGEDIEIVLNFGDRTSDCQIDALGDTDRFRFAGTAGETIRLIVLDTGSSSFNAVVEVFGPNGDRITTVTSQSDLALNLTGNYMLIVSDSGSDAIGNYMLALERFLDLSTLPLIPDTPPANLPDGLPALSDTIDFVSDLDFFVFTGTAGETIRLIVLDTGSSSFNAVVEVFDPNGDRITTVTSQSDLTLDLTGSYRLIVSDSGLDAIGDYTLFLEQFPAISTLPVVSYASPSVSDTIDSVADLDFFVFQGAAGTTIQFGVVDMGSSSFNAVIEVFDPNGDRITTVTSQSDLTLDLTGDYRLIVSDSGVDAIGAYDLSLICLFGGCPTEVPGPVMSVDLISVVPSVFTPEGGVFEITIMATDTGGNRITDKVTPGNFRLRGVQATLLEELMSVTPATATDVTGVAISVDSQVVVMGTERFDPPLQAGMYLMSGVLETVFYGVEVETPFEFSVEIEVTETPSVRQ